MRILALANAHALAHVSRLLEIARPLRAKGHDIAFAGHGQYLPIAQQAGFEIFELPYVSLETVKQAVRSQRLWLLFPEDEVERYVEAELALFAQFRPDLVLLDTRPTARATADKLGIPSVAVTNVQMTNYRRFPFYSYVQLTGWAGWPIETLDRLENRLERQVYDRFVMGGLNRVRRRLELPRLYAYEHEEGSELTLLSDVPEFNPCNNFPERVHYVGPLTWHNDMPAPSCLASLDADRPIVYFSLGSASLDELVSSLSELAEAGIQAVVAGGAEVTEEGQLYPGIWLERYVNADALLPHCALVCCHGGNGTLYQALTHGLPCITVASHAEQHYGGKRVAQLGLGRSLRLGELRRKGMPYLIAAVRQVLAEPAYRERARAMQATIGHWRPAETAVARIETVIDDLGAV